MLKIKKVGVIGCGTMGSQYVQVCAQAGYQVRVLEINEDILKKRLSAIRARLDESVEPGKPAGKERSAVLARIKGTIDLKDFSDCDLVVENAPENLDIKKKLFSEMDRICPAHTILATNTSALSIIHMAGQTGRPDKVIGIHGAPLAVSISEIVKTIATRDETLEISKEFVSSLGLTYIVVPDVPGFMTNRVKMPFLLAAVRALEAGLATRDEIDNFFTKGMGFPMGPLADIDRGGLDTVLYLNTAIYEETKDPTYLPPVLLKKMVAAGWLGQKTGKGFYDYK
jgi:3-hydroxybutyryl-CoA dehydrogenase